MQQGIVKGLDDHLIDEIPHQSAAAPDFQAYLIHDLTFLLCFSCLSSIHYNPSRDITQIFPQIGIQDKRGVDIGREHVAPGQSALVKKGAIAYNIDFSDKITWVLNHVFRNSC
jgi:hypothetical protein